MQLWTFQKKEKLGWKASRGYTSCSRIIAPFFFSGLAFAHDGWCLALRNSDHHTHQRPLRPSRDKLKLAERIVAASSILRKEHTKICDWNLRVLFPLLFQVMPHIVTCRDHEKQRDVYSWQILIMTYLYEDLLAVSIFICKHYRECN